MRKIFLFLAVAIVFLSIQSIAQTVTFSKERGYYTSTFSITLTTDLSGATIKYTTNGTPPSSSVGTTYSGPISISTTTAVRAIAYKTGATTKIFTTTYIFPSKVILQPANISGWPNNLYDIGTGSTDVEHDYEMDPEIVNDPAYSGQIVTGLTSIPSMSIVMDKALFWEMYDGDEIEHPASGEIIYPNNISPSEQFDCTIEGHSWIRLKRSMHIGFADPGITTKLFKNAPLNGGNASEHVDDRKIVLRAGNNDSWARNWNTDGTTYSHDEWYRASQIAVSGFGSHGTYVHLYVNGLYWGLYNPVERPDDGFAAEYFGGNQNDWLSLDQDDVNSGDPARYDYLSNTLINKDLSTAANYAELKQYLDVSDFCDYMIVSWMPGMDDWPNNNYYGANRNNPAEPFMFFGWDGEWSWTNLHGSNNGAWVSPYFENNVSGGPIIASIWHSARDNQDFMMLFADRVYKNCFNGGPMTDAVSRARWATINNYISTAIIAESARWGDAEDENDPRTKNGNWQPEVNRIDGLMNGNVTRFITALRAEGYYPTLNPPTFNSEGGQVSANFQLTMSNPNGSGTIYYTTNGNDPRLSGGALSGDAISYSAAITINSSKTIKARVKNGTSWSALHEGTYDIYNLKINEFLADNINGTTDEQGDHEDWIEIYNNSPVPVNIGGMYLTDLLSQPKKWQIPTSNAALTTIPAYGFKLIWADQETTEGLLHANFKFTQAGEQLGLSVSTGATTTKYLDSLIFGAQTTDVSRGRLPDGTGAFQSFTSPTPGLTNQQFTQSSKLYINEFLASNQTDIVDEAGVHDDWFEIYNDNTFPVNIGGLYVTDNLATPTMWQIPTNAPNTTTIPAKGFLLLWADSEPAQGPLHVNFKLGNGGEQIALVQLSGNNNIIIDSLSFGAQLANVSRGRLPNGGNSFTNFTTTTPGASNQGSTPVDCNGVANGTAVADDCGICSGGNTGHVANSDKDACGVCFGDGSSCTPPPQTCVQNEIVSFTLMRTGTSGEIGPLVNGTVINLATIGSFSVRANACNQTVGSVKFILNGSSVRTETAPPYAINGDSPTGSYTKWNVSVGNYTLEGKPYTGSGGSGTAGISEIVTFTVVNQQGGTPDCNGVAGGSAHLNSCGICVGGNTGLGENQGKDCNGVCSGSATIDDCGECSGGNTGHVANSDKDECGVCFGDGSSCAPPPACVQNEVISFTLMKAGTAGEIGPLTNGKVINLSTIGNFSVRANVCSTPVGSVKFVLNGSTIRTETEPPYAIKGDSPVGSYTAWKPNAGSYTLVGKPYTGSNGSGTSGVTETVTFTVISGSSKMSEDENWVNEEISTENIFEFSIYPNPNNGSFVIEAYNEIEANFSLRIYNSLGQVVLESLDKEISGSLTKTLNIDVPSGIYFVEMNWGEQIRREKVLVR